MTRTVNNKDGKEIGSISSEVNPWGNKISTIRFSDGSSGKTVNSPMWFGPDDVTTRHNKLTRENPYESVLNYEKELAAALNSESDINDSEYDDEYDEDDEDDEINSIPNNNIDDKTDNLQGNNVISKSLVKKEIEKVNSAKDDIDLKMMASLDSDPEVRKMATIRRINEFADDIDLKMIASLDPDLEVRKMATIRRINEFADDIDLKMIASLDPDPEVRKMAERKLNNKKINNNSISHESSVNTFSDYLVDLDLPLLKRAEMAEEITDEFTLKYMAEKDKESWIRLIAISKITDYQTLYRIAKTDKDPEIRKSAKGLADAYRKIAEIQKL